MVTSAPPSEALVVSLSSYDACWLSPSTLANRCQSASRGPSGGGTVTRWICSGGSEAPHVAMIRGRCCTRQNHTVQSVRV
jgi:hypothetical protein